MRETFCPFFYRRMLTQVSAAVLACAQISAVQAAPPTGGSYNQFTSASGSIVASCPVGACCGTAITGDGFYQRSIVVGGNTYFQTIALPGGLSSPSSSGYLDENFVQQPSGSGIQDTGSSTQSSSAPTPTAAPNPDTQWTFESKAPVEPYSFNLSYFVGKPLLGSVPSSSSSSATSSCGSVPVQTSQSFLFPAVSDLPELIADGAPDAAFAYTIVDAKTGAVVSEAKNLLVVPRVNIQLDQVVVEGGFATVKVFVSGDPRAPITVPYTVGGTATPGVDHGAADGEITIPPYTTGEITFPVYEDKQADPGETVIVTLGKPSNADLGDNIRHTVIISEDDRYITASLKGLLHGSDVASRVSHIYLGTNCCSSADPIVIKANAKANFPEPTLHYDWSGTDAALLEHANISGSTLSLYLDEQALPAGIYTAKVSVSSDKYPEVVAATELPIKVVVDLADFITNDDSDSDGIPNGIERAIFDHNGNWIQDYLDAFYVDSILQLSSQPENAGDTKIDKTLDDGTLISFEWLGFVGTDMADSRLAMTSDVGTGLRLGKIAFSLGANGAAIPVEKFKEAAVALYSDNADLAKIDAMTGKAIYDAEVTGLPTPGQSVHVVLPLQDIGLSSSAVWAYSPNRGWSKFESDARNNISSTIGYQVHNKLFSCPGVGDASFTEGDLSECVRLTVEDGGPNDADGERNGVVGVMLAEGPMTPVAVSSSDDKGGTANGGGGGGVLGLWSFFMLVVMAWWRTKKVRFCKSLRANGISC